MSRLTTAVAACAAIGAIAAGAAAPAGAQAAEAPAGVINVCGKPSPSINDCVNWTFDAASQTVATVEREFDRIAGPYVCDVNWILTGETCP
jgi:hypothetical protein